jgi:hypothetical protein
VLEICDEPLPIEREDLAHGRGRCEQSVGFFARASVPSSGEGAVAHHATAAREDAVAALVDRGCGHRVDVVGTSEPCGKRPQVQRTQAGV